MPSLFACPLPGLRTRELGPGSEAVLQRFFDANPPFFIANSGEPPKPILEQIHRVVLAAFDADLKVKLADSGMEVATSSPEELQRLIAQDIALHAELVKAAGLVPQ